MTKPEDQMKFEYFAGPQRSPEWFALRLGKVTASRLPDWLAVSKAKTGAGKPLKARLDYEKELMFERTFGRNYDKYVTPAMQNGIEYEDFARRQFEKIMNVSVEPCGAWYSDIFVASPDGTISTDGLFEAKVLGDNSFSDVLESGVPEKHWQQIQGQLWSSKRAYCYYTAINLNTRKVVIIKVLPDEEFHDWLELILLEPITVDPFSVQNVYDFADGVQLPPQKVMGEFLISVSDNENEGGW